MSEVEETKKRKIDEVDDDDSNRKKTEDNQEFDTLGEQDVVACVCGEDQEDGIMIQCDKCTFWQHAVCVEGLENATNEDIEKITNYICEICKEEQKKKEGKRKKKKKEEEKDYNPDEEEEFEDVEEDPEHKSEQEVGGEEEDEFSDEYDE